MWWSSTPSTVVRPRAAGRAARRSGVEVVLHAGRQDVALLRRVWGTRLTNVFDTQIAAGFAGLRAQLGYEPLVHEMLGLRLNKSASFTRWDARPLSPEQLRYAEEDVVHLLALADALQARLRGSGAWSGRARSAASSRRSPTTATPRRSSAVCPASAAWTRASGPSRASSSSGARRPPATRTARSPASSRTPC